MIAGLFSVCLLIAGGLYALLSRKIRTASKIGSISCCVALAVGFISALDSLCFAWIPNSLFSFSAFFQIPVCVLGFAAAIYIPDYLKRHAEGRTGIFWFFFNMMLAAMLAVPMMSKIIPFLIVWELMGLFCFGLIAFEFRQRNTPRAVWLYLLSFEAGGMLLMLLAALPRAELSESSLAISMFVVGLLAFGLKLALPFLHVWLPETYQTAPAPVAGVMSAAMTPLGFYGLLRFAIVSGDYFAVYGWTLLLLGLAAVFSGILFGLAEKDLKKLLAYSSIENVGIMSVGFGFGFLGLSIDSSWMTVCGVSGAFLHILNHALLKGVLFFGAGAVVKSAHTANMDQLGGLMKRMPWTGGIFTMASIGICGLPPFCCFTGELLIYLAAFNGILKASGTLFATSFIAAVVLGISGGLACAAFTKAVSSVFSGEPRSEFAIKAHREKKRMVVAQLILFIPALLMPLLAPVIVRCDIFGQPSPELIGILWKVAILSVVVSLFFGGLLLLRRRLPRGTETADGPTWDCGYARPTARMEYTATAFAQPLMDLFHGLLRPRKYIHLPKGLFPDKASVDIETDDFSDRLFWTPLFRLIGSAANKIHRLQSGYLHLYILVMVIAVAVMLAWGFASTLYTAPPAPPVAEDVIVGPAEKEQTDEN